MEFDESMLGYGNYILQKFQFENGEVLNEVNVEYYISGTPKYDDDGNIINAVVFCHSFSGSCYSINELYKITTENAPFNKYENFIISITTLGIPESCSPSVTGLYYKFPEYSALDCVNFKRQFLKEFLGIDHVFGVMGVGMGGYEVYTWACEYPDEMDFIIVCDSSFRTNGYRYAVSKAVFSMLESSEGFYSETYGVSLSKTLISIYRFIYSNYFSKRIFQEMSNDEIDVLMDDFVEEGLFTDIYDLKYKNDVILNYDVEDKLKNIKVMTLIFANTDDIYYSHEFDSVPLNNLIENSEIILYESSKGPGGHLDSNSLNEILTNFLKKVKNKKS